MRLHCCGCGVDVTARLTDGGEIYPHRPDLAEFPFWKCDACGNHVGCHHKTSNRTAPLGCIPTPELRNARQHIHALIDPAYKSGIITRKKLYACISAEVGWSYHTAKIRTLDEARAVYRAAQRCISNSTRMEDDGLQAERR